MRARRPALVFIFITLFLDILGIGLVIPVLPRLVEQFRGGDVASASHVVGWLGALYALMQFLFSPILATSLFGYFISPQAPVPLPGIPFFLGTALAATSLAVALATLRRNPQAGSHPSSG